MHLIRQLTIGWLLIFIGLNFDARLLYILSTVAVVLAVLGSMVALTVALQTPPLDRAPKYLESPLSSNVTHLFQWYRSKNSSWNIIITLAALRWQEDGVLVLWKGNLSHNGKEVCPRICMLQEENVSCYSERNWFEAARDSVQENRDSVERTVISASLELHLKNSGQKAAKQERDSMRKLWRGLNRVISTRQSHLYLCTAVET